MRLSCTVYTTITLVLFSSIVLHANNIESFPVWNQTWTDRLKQDLFVKYDKFARPTEYFNTTGTKFGIAPLFINVDDFKYTVTVTGMVRLSWIDEKLKWDPAKYGNITHINIGNHEVWQPDILLYNSGTSSTVKYYGDAPCLVYSSGNVLCVPPAKLIAYCELDFRLWPFDTQICDLKFGSWTYHSEQIDLQFFKEYEAEELKYVKSAEWTLINMSRIHEVKMYPCCAEPYTSLIYRMTLKRNSSLFCSILLMPAAAIIFLLLVPFWLPPQSEMKISIAAITILIISVLLGVFAFKVPFSVTPPLIVYFYSGCLCLETISLILSIVVINVSKRVYCKPFSRNIRLCLLSWPGKLLGLSDLISVIESRRSVPSQELRGKLTDESTTNATSTVSDNGDRQNVTPSTKDTTQLEWILVGTAIDRITFVLFCLILATMAIVCIR